MKRMNKILAVITALGIGAGSVALAQDQLDQDDAIKASAPAAVVEVASKDKSTTTVYSVAKFDANLPKLSKEAQEKAIAALIASGDMKKIGDTVTGTADQLDTDSSTDSGFRHRRSYSYGWYGPGYVAPYYYGYGVPVVYAQPVTYYPPAYYTGGTYYYAPYGYNAYYRPYNYYYTSYYANYSYSFYRW
jgi:hypothetical protein